MCLSDSCSIFWDDNMDLYGRCFNYMFMTRWKMFQGFSRRFHLKNWNPNLKPPKWPPSEFPSQSSSIPWRITTVPLSGTCRLNCQMAHRNFNKCSTQTTSIHHHSSPFHSSHNFHGPRQPWGSKRTASTPPRAAEDECHDLSKKHRRNLG